MKLSKKLFWQNRQPGQKISIWPKYQFWLKCQHLHLPHFLPFHALTICFFSVPKRNICSKESETLKSILSTMGSPFQIITHNQSTNYVNIASLNCVVISNCREHTVQVSRWHTRLPMIRNGCNRYATKIDFCQFID